MNNEAMLEMKMLQDQMEHLQKQMQEIEEKIEQAKELKKALKEFTTIKEGSEILMPVSNGIFAKGKITDVKNLKVNVGGGVIVGKTIDQTQKIIEEQIIELKKISESASDNFDELVENAEKIAGKLE